MAFKVYDLRYKPVLNTISIHATRPHERIKWKVSCVYAIITSISNDVCQWRWESFLMEFVCWFCISDKRKVLKKRPGNWTLILRSVSFQLACKNTKSRVFVSYWLQVAAKVTPYSVYDILVAQLVIFLRWSFEASIVNVRPFPITQVVFGSLNNLVFLKHKNLLTWQQCLHGLIP